MSRNNDNSACVRRRWLCIAYAFPPVNRSGTHRTVGFVRHLFDRGFDATVITAKPDGESIDETLCDRVPDSTRVVQTRCRDLVSLLKRLSIPGKRSVQRVATSEKDNGSRHDARQREAAGVGASSIEKDAAPRGMREWVSRLLQTPDSKIGWIPSAADAGLAAIRRDKPEVIYSTSPYVSAHIVAMILKWRTKLPWVADFRDPWGDNPFREFGFKSVGRVDAWLERLVLRNASHIVMNTPTARDALCKRYPTLAGKCSTITNGIDFDLIESVVPQRVVPDDCFSLTHCGQFYGKRSPQPWFDALRKIRATDPTLAARIRLVLVGAAVYDGRDLADLAAEAGVGDLVIVTGKKSHAETLSIMAGSDALALATNVGAGSELQIPNKLFEYLGMRKPIVAAVDARSPAKAILEDVGLAYSICAPGDVHGLARAIRECFVRVSTDDVTWEASAVKKLGREYQAAALARIIERLTGTANVRAMSPTLDSVEDERVRCSLSLDGGVGAMSADHAGFSG
jgi:Glycosyl transferase 4-like domain/Glycosyl transferases group 1